jgi:DNA-binding NarL/FixJ family response regulator
MILVIDDHALFREGLGLLLARLEQAQPILEASSIEMAMGYREQADFVGLILMDIYLPDADGLQGLRLIRKSYPSSPIVLVSASHDSALIQEAMHSGAQGFIHKTATGDAMLKGLEQVLGGDDCYVYPGELGSISKPRNGKLTSRQIEVLSQLCLGKSNREIGQALALSENTVRVHLVEIFRVLGVASRAEAIVMARSTLFNDRDMQYRQQ